MDDVIRQIVEIDGGLRARVELDKLGNVAQRKVDAVLVVGIPVNPAEQERLSLMGVEIYAAGGQVVEDRREIGAHASRVRGASIGPAGPGASPPAGEPCDRGRLAVVLAPDAR